MCVDLCMDSARHVWIWIRLDLFAWILRGVDQAFDLVAVSFYLDPLDGACGSCDMTPADWLGGDACGSCVAWIWIRLDQVTVAWIRFLIWF